MAVVDNQNEAVPLEKLLLVTCSLSYVGQGCSSAGAQSVVKCIVKLPLRLCLLYASARLLFLWFTCFAGPSWCCCPLLFDRARFLSSHLFVLGAEAELASDPAVRVAKDIVQWSQQP